MWERFEIQWTLYNMHMDGHVHIYCPHLTPYSPIYKLREMLSSRQLGETEKCSFEETFLKIQKYIHLSMDVTLDSPHPTPHTIYLSFLQTKRHISLYSFENDIKAVLKLKCSFWRRDKNNWKYRNTFVYEWASILLDRPYPALLDHIPQYTLFRPNGYQFLPSDCIHFKQLILKI